VLLYGGSLSFGSQNLAMFAWVSVAYLMLALLFFATIERVRRRFNLYLTLQVTTDILALTLLMYASGGAKSGLAFMLLVVVAGAGLVGQGRLTLFYAALAALAVQFEQGYRMLEFGAYPADFVQAGITSIAFFATAITAHLLARRVVANEELARRRGVALADQLRINQRVIRDMQDGVLVVDAEGRVNQHNPQAEALLGVRVRPEPDLAAFSATLVEFYARWRWQSVEAAESFRAANGRLLRARFLPAGEGGNALIYLEDLDRVQAQAQQLKLAALGRLTANMAHEIRNPLSAVSHAAELLLEEQRGEMQTRLIGIIGDNTGRINRLIGEVLELGRRDRAQVEPLRLPDFLESFLAEYAQQDPRAGRTIRLSVDGQPVLCFDRVHLNRVLWNLLGNALRHCRGEAGSIRLEARTSANPERTELHIIDDGTGIDPSLRAQVFEPFFTTHASGTGLGLYIARELCEANGAVLEVLDNAPGAHFCIRGAACR
jgi:two-component system sensor histidine kinase PilS (NtrC family)